jgi:hypothetical protein
MPPWTPILRVFGAPFFLTGSQKDLDALASCSETQTRQVMLSAGLKGLTPAMRA